MGARKLAADNVTAISCAPMAMSGLVRKTNMEATCRQAGAAAVTSNRIPVDKIYHQAQTRQKQVASSTGRRQTGQQGHASEEAVGWGAPAGDRWERASRQGSGRQEKAGKEAAGRGRPAGKRWASIDRRGSGEQGLAGDKEAFGSVRSAGKRRAHSGRR